VVEEVVVASVSVVVAVAVLVCVRVAVNEAVTVFVVETVLVCGCTRLLQADDILSTGKGNQGGMFTSRRFLSGSMKVDVCVVVVLRAIVNQKRH
jgi:hypothetical protein